MSEGSAPCISNCSITSTCGPAARASMSLPSLRSCAAAYSCKASSTYLATACSPSKAEPSAVCPERSRKLTDACAASSSETTFRWACLAAVCSAAVPFSVVASMMSGVRSGGPLAASSSCWTARRLPAAATTISGVTPESEEAITEAPLARRRPMSLLEPAWQASSSGATPSVEGATWAPALRSISASDSAPETMALVSSGTPCVVWSFGSAPASSSLSTD
mmetsp:Transcript_683/g.1564  ORF Transcript_683/g.1564 Transcript_683/m.1564 type:complete len:221 (+) Transcript_683:667-1329(+)